VIINERDLNVDVWFLDFGKGQEPPQGFLDRFTDLEIPVKDRSQATVDLFKGVREAVTDKHGAIAKAKILRWTGPFTAEVEYSYYLNAKAAWGEKVVIRYVNGKWQVVETLEIWVS
jgi:hypothetical protein